ncbi:histone-like nucleoid-structuring protein, MvaT/MvaU family [Pseudomonas sp.]|uniref:histone-like nucleoid-structuring protein, MvaT/MvaU family n=1 Tax=Pseudomonas sp. TaxID=306 RepID=UPI002612D094|nr:histone-like nucleoid-structuring protein, MvaT/MvaU family [Pseudomonas sp.]
MSKLAEFRQLERLLAEQLQALEAMKSDKGLEAEIEFEGKLRTLLGEYSKSLRDVVAILDPHPTVKGVKTGATSEKVTRRARTLKVYNNPLTGESIETKGGNHKLLKAWKSEHGSDKVESWLKR